MNMKEIVSNKITEKLLYQQYSTLDFINSINANYAIIKGAVLSNYCYNNITSREIGDVDILISRRQIKNLEEALIKNGFLPVHEASRYVRALLVATSHQYISYFKETSSGNVLIDINFDIFWGEYEGNRINIDEFLSDTAEMEICGRVVRTLPPMKAFIQLILHDYKDMNSLFLLSTRGRIRQSMFKDIYFLLKNNADKIPLDKLYDICTEYEIVPYVFYILYYTGQVYEDDFLKQYIEAFRTHEGELLLDSYGLCEKERHLWKYNFETRLNSNNLYELIKGDLTENDKQKIAINKRVFWGINE